MRRHLLLVVTVTAPLALGVGTPLLAAEKKITNLTGTHPSADEIKRALTPDETGLEDLGPPRGLQFEIVSQTKTTPTVALSIEFDFASASLTPAAVETLAVVATALGDRSFQGVIFQVEGHTDAVGSEQYNRELSSKRAGAVRDHLVRVHGILPEVLRVLGRGETELLDKANPESSVNRRVEISNLGSDPEQVASVTPVHTTPTAERLTRAKTGSGFFINQDGHLLTSHDLVESCVEIKVASAGQDWVAAHQSSDAANKLALLNVPSRTTTFVEFREGRGIRRDAAVEVVGILGGDTARSAGGTVGALTGPDQQLSFMQIQADLGPEYLGGPVIDTSGAVVALTVDAGAKVGLATKSSVVRTFLDSADVDYHTTGQGTSAGFVASTARVECWR